MYNQVDNFGQKKMSNRVDNFGQNFSRSKKNVIPERQKRHICGECGKKRVFKKLYKMKGCKHYFCIHCFSEWQAINRNGILFL